MDKQTRKDAISQMAITARRIQSDGGKTTMEDFIVLTSHVLAGHQAQIENLQDEIAYLREELLNVGVPLSQE